MTRANTSYKFRSKSKSKPRKSYNRSNRPSPSVSAKLYPINYMKTGNDRHIWIIKSASNGVHRWVKTTANTMNNS